MERRMVIAPLVAVILMLGAAPAFAQEDADGREPAGQPDETRMEDQPRMFVDGVEYRGGDGDGVPEPGERLEVIIGLVNAQPETLADIRATLESLSPEVTVVQDAASWPDLTAKERAEGAPAFVITIAPDAEASPPCQPLPEPQPIDGDKPVDSDGGTTLIAPAPDDGAGGGADGASGGQGSTPGSAGEDQPAEEEPATTGTVEPEPGADDPAVIEPAPPVREPKEEGGVPVEEQQDPPVTFSLVLHVTSGGETDDLPIDSGLICAYTTMGAPEPAPGPDQAARDGSSEELAAGAGDDSASPTGRSAAPLAAVLLAAVGALVLRWGSVQTLRRAMQ